MKVFMREVSVEMAKYLYYSDVQVYRLYPDGTEGLVEKVAEIYDHHDRGGIFGVEE